MSRRLGGRIALLVLVALLTASVALAAAPKKGASYRGTLAAPRTGFVITFKVSADGKKVTALKINNLPAFCSSGGPPVPLSFRNATIGAGKFKSTATQHISTGPLKGQIGAKLTITGAFANGGKERGKLSVKFGRAPACNGSSTYTTHAA